MEVFYLVLNLPKLKGKKREVSLINIAMVSSNKDLVDLRLSFITHTFKTQHQASTHAGPPFSHTQSSSFGNNRRDLIALRLSTQHIHYYAIYI